MRFRRMVMVGAGAGLALAAVAGCTQSTDQAVAPSSTAALIATGTVPVVTNDLAANSAHQSVAVPGEQFGLQIDYWTDVDATTWQTLQPKAINLSVHLVPAATTTGDPPEVLMGSFDAVTTLLAAMPGLDGLPIAVTHEASSSLPGFVISASYPFDSQLPIEGFSAPLQARWQTLAADEPLTESGLVKAGVYGNRMTFTYRVLVRNTGDPGYHQRIVQSTLTVPEAAPATAGAAGSTAVTTG